MKPGLPKYGAVEQPLDENHFGILSDSRPSIRATLTPGKNRCGGAAAERLQESIHRLAIQILERDLFVLKPSTEIGALALMGHMSRAMLERYSHIRMTAKRDAVAGVTLRQKSENSEVVPVVGRPVLVQ